MTRVILYLFLPIIFFGGSVKAQQGQPAMLNVVYEFTHINDLSKPSKPYREDMLLVLGLTESRYTRNFKKIQIQSLKKTRDTESTGRSGNISVMGGPVAVVSVKPETNKEIFQLLQSNQLNITATLGMQTYLIAGVLPAIKWNVINEVKTIGNYICQKAIGEYAGRVYTAWFAPDLPYHNGPWKLSGLPGLILEAEDSKKEVQFLFKELYKAVENESTISLNGNSFTFVKTNVNSFAKLENAYNQNPTAAFQAQLPSNAPKVQTIFIDESGQTTFGEQAKSLIEKNKKEAKLKNYNPLELIKN